MVHVEVSVVAVSLKTEGRGVEISPRGSSHLRPREWIAILFFVTANLVVPLVKVELYPFSRFPMFAGAPRQLVIYRVTDPFGRELPARDFGLELNPDDNPPTVGHGFLPLPTLNELGAMPDGNSVAAWVQARLAAAGTSPAFVDIVGEVYGPTPEGSFGLVANEAWRIRNPH
jgi:hypothetical protein